MREGGDCVDIQLQEEPADERSQQRPGGVTSPGESEVRMLGSSVAGVY